MAPCRIYVLFCVGPRYLQIFVSESSYITVAKLWRIVAQMLSNHTGRLQTTHSYVVSVVSIFYKSSIFTFIDDKENEKLNYSLTISASATLRLDNIIIYERSLSHFPISMGSY